MHTGCTPEVHRRYTGQTVVHPVCIRCASGVHGLGSLARRRTPGRAGFGRGPAFWPLRAPRVPTTGAASGLEQCKYSAKPQLIVLVVVLVIAIERSLIEHEDEDDDENDTQSGFAEGLRSRGYGHPLKSLRDRPFLAAD